MFTDLDLQKVSDLFTWLGVVKPVGQDAVPVVSEECPICYEVCTDVQQLLHECSGSRDVSSHRACQKCRQQMLERNQSCPWCRDNMVWQELFGFLDGLKKNISQANKPDDLAD